MQRAKALIAWSSGKDSAWAMHEIQRAGEYEVVGALTTVTATYAQCSGQFDCVWVGRPIRGLRTP